MAILLEERFNGTLDDWTVVDEADATISAPSNWSISSDDDCRQSTNIVGFDDLPRKPGTFLTYDLGASWTLYSMDLRLISSDNDNIGFMVYYQDVDNYIQYRSDNQNSEEILWQKVAGVQTELASNTFSYTINKWYDYEVVLASGTVNIKREGVELFGGDVTTTGLASGTVALFSSNNATSTFDSIIVDDNIPTPPVLLSPPMMTVNGGFNQGSGVVF